MALDHALLRNEYAARFAGTPRLFRAPGRVNLIGEHTDYNDGFVLPCAIDREVVFAVTPRADRVVRLAALDFDPATVVEFDLDDAGFVQSQHHWSNYVKGMVSVLEANGFGCSGFEGIIAGDVPIGGGVSSSSAFTAAVATTLEVLNGLTVDPKRMVELILDAENAATGLRGGIMDQYTARMGKAGSALLIDCRIKEHEIVSLPEMTIVVADTRRARTLAATAYNERRAQCELASRLIATRYPGVTALRDVTNAMLDDCRDLLSRDVYRRARHVVTETERTHASVELLAKGDLERFGRLVTQSHQSLRDDYEVSCEELDALCEIAWTVPGVYGARMVGAGFGGCIIAVCEAGAVAPLTSALMREYARRCGREADVYATVPSDGAGEIL
ncbi:MAG: galactokinase [Armatimonadetes bacterium]|nr:galactokinase [Armatimonadota bacterium]